MFKRVGIFGVRRRINQIVEFLNDSVVEVKEDWASTVEGKFDGIAMLFGCAFRQQAENIERIKTLEARVRHLEKVNANRMALEIVRKMGDKLDDECLSHALEAIEGLDARLTSLEDALSPPDETGETSETPREEDLPDPEEESEG